MLKAPLFRFITCLIILGYFLYLYVDEHNKITRLRLKIPPLSAEVQELEEEKRRLLYQRAKLENPKLLMELLRNPQFGYLKKPLRENIWYLGSPPYE